MPSKDERFQQFRSTDFPTSHAIPQWTADVSSRTFDWEYPGTQRRKPVLARTGSGQIADNPAKPAEPDQVEIMSRNNRRSNPR
jgi:hypothetical protein